MKAANEMKTWYMETNSPDDSPLSDDILGHMLLHDIKTPLSLIGGYVARLISEKAGPINDKQREYFEIIWAELRRMEHIINSHQDRPTPGGIHAKDSTNRFDLKKGLRELSQLFGNMAAERNIRLLVSVPAGISPIKGDSRQLYRVFENLLKNALLYTRRGGRVEIRATDNDSYVVCEFRDSGIGMRNHELSHVFTPFYRSAEAAEKAGSGLGLAIVKNIVEACGGKVWVESEYGKGSIFFVKLPTG